MRLKRSTAWFRSGKKNKTELKEEDYKHFYTEKFYDYNEPLKYSHVKNEGNANYNALLYIPSKAPYDFYSKEYEKGLQLYSNGVLIMDKCSDLLPDYYSFVKWDLSIPRICR